MSPGTIVWPLCFITTQWLWTGCVSSAELLVQKNQVTGIENRSVLLPVSYGVQYQHYIKISWSFQAFSTPFLIWSSLNSSGNCSRQFFTWKSYSNCTTFFPENASLLLQNLQLNDTGTYRVKVRGDSGSATGQIKLTVLLEAETREEAGGIQELKRKAGTVKSTRAVNIIRITLAPLLVCLCFVTAFVGRFLK